MYIAKHVNWAGFPGLGSTVTSVKVFPLFTGKKIKYDKDEERDKEKDKEKDEKNDEVKEEMKDEEKDEEKGKVKVTIAMTS